MLKNLFSKKTSVGSSSVESPLPDMSFNDGLNIYFESAYRNQEICFRRSTPARPITLGEVLQGLFGWGRDKVISLGEAYRFAMVDDSTSERVLTDPDAIWSYDLFSTVLKYQTDDGDYSNGLDHETTLILHTSDKDCILTCIALGGGSGVHYMRVSVMVSDPDGTADDGRSMIGQNQPKSPNIAESVSFVLSHAVFGDSPLFGLYDRTLESLRAAHRADEQPSDLQTQLLSGVNEFPSGWSKYGYAEWLASEHRYFDALIQFERMFARLHGSFDSLDDEGKQFFYRLCSMMGDCLTHLGRDVEAAYYYKRAAAGRQMERLGDLYLTRARLGDAFAVQEMISAAKEAGRDTEGKQMVAGMISALDCYRKRTADSLSAAPAVGNAVSVGYVLDSLWGMQSCNLFPLMMVYDARSGAFMDKVEGREAIAGYVLNRAEAVGKTFVLSATYAYYHTGGKEGSKLCDHAPLVISTHAVSVPDSDAVMRVELMRSNFNNDDCKRGPSRFNEPLHASFCLGLVSADSFTADKESLLEAYHAAVRMRDEQRFMEALKLFLWVYEYASHHLKTEPFGADYDFSDPLLRDIFFEACYGAGFCLMELNCISQAAYYLELACYRHVYQYIQEYINCLSNSGDPLALTVVDDVMAQSPRPEGDKAVEEWEWHMAFLKRRKAFVLVEKQLFDRAVPLLKEMLADPLCADFARGELRYIEERRTKG